jgi:hypothetical protein
MCEAWLILIRLDIHRVLSLVEFLIGVCFVAFHAVDCRVCVRDAAARTIALNRVGASSFSM